MVRSTRQTDRATRPKSYGGASRWILSSWGANVAWQPARGEVFAVNQQVAEISSWEDEGTSEEASFAYVVVSRPPDFSGQT